MKRSKLMMVSLGILLAAAFLSACSSGCQKIRDEVDEIADDTLIRPVDRAKEARLKSDLGSIRRSISAFQAHHGRFPESLDELSAKGVLTRIPREAFGGSWEYDSYTGDVHSSTYPDW